MDGRYRRLRGRALSADTKQTAIARRIDLLVNNAGIGLLGGAEDSSSAQARALLDVNVFGALRVTNAVLPTMRRQGKGRIVDLSSVLGFIPATTLSTDTATGNDRQQLKSSLVQMEPSYA